VSGRVLCTRLVQEVPACPALIHYQPVRRLAPSSARAVRTARPARCWLALHLAPRATNSASSSVPSVIERSELWWSAPPWAATREGGLAASLNPRT